MSGESGDWLAPEFAWGVVCSIVILSGLSDEGAGVVEFESSWVEPKEEIEVIPL